MASVPAMVRTPAVEPWLVVAGGSHLRRFQTQPRASRGRSDNASAPRGPAHACGSVSGAPLSGSSRTGASFPSVPPVDEELRRARTEATITAGLCVLPLPRDAHG